MFVRTYMTKNPITASPETTFPEAMSLLRKYHIRRLPVVERGELVGIIVEQDLLSNQPSPATTLSIYEIYSLLEHLHLSQMMAHPVITVEGDCPIEEAARIMCDFKIGCLPVMDGSDLVGIITETDIFKVLVEVLGGAEASNRLTLRLSERKGELAAISAQIAEAGGNILAVTTSRLLEGNQREVMIKESGAEPEELKAALAGLVEQVVDIRPSTRYQPGKFG